MVLGFAVVAIFFVAVFSTIVATVNEMKKPPAPDYGPTPLDMADMDDSLIPLPYRFSYQTLNPNSTYTRHTPYDEDMSSQSELPVIWFASKWFR